MQVHRNEANGSVVQMQSNVVHEESMALLARDAICGRSQSWFVYLLALSDCTAFKIGFSNNPLQRIHSFSHRYFERFDLHQSQLLRVGECAEARFIEATLKTELQASRMQCPGWIPRGAGGHTEWFSAVDFGQAANRLQGFADVDAASLRVTRAFDFIRGELGRMSLAFETLVADQARAVQALANNAMAFREASRPLRDWLDAYRYFDLPLFADEPDVRGLVAEVVRSR